MPLLPSSAADGRSATASTALRPVHAIVVGLGLVASPVLPREAVIPRAAGPIAVVSTRLVVEHVLVHVVAFSGESSAE